MLARMMVSRCCCDDQPPPVTRLAVLLDDWGYLEDQGDQLVEDVAALGFFRLGRSSDFGVANENIRVSSAFSFNLNVPQGATINSAQMFISFQGAPAAQPTQPVVGDFFLRNVDNGDQVSRPANEYINWVLVPGSVAYSFALNHTVTFTSLLQQIVNRPGWQSGNIVNGKWETDPASAAETQDFRAWIGEVDVGIPQPAINNYVDVSWS